jgi:biotin operon repressor
LADGETDKAQQHCQAALSLLDDSGQQTAGWRRVHFAAYQVFADDPPKALYHLRQAGTAVQTQAHKLPKERQQPFLQKVSLNRQIMTAVAQRSQQQVVRLVRADVPLGRKLTEADYVEISWTLTSPLDETAANPVQRRRAVLLRLLREAAAQGTAPTDDDLAHALGVSRRTIERDMAALQAEAIPPTRRRN